MSFKAHPRRRNFLKSTSHSHGNSLPDRSASRSVPASSSRSAASGSAAARSSVARSTAARSTALPLRPSVPRSSASRSTTARSSVAPKRVTSRPTIERRTPARHRVNQSVATRSLRSISQPASEFTSASVRDQLAEEEQADEDADALGEVVMAVELSKKGTLGCSYYIAQDEKLYFMEDMQLASVEMIDMLKLFINPTVVLISSVADDAVLNTLDPNSEARGSDGGSGDQFSLPYVLELRPKAEFGYEPAKTKLARLRIGEQDGPKVSFVIPGDVHTYDDFDEFEQNVSGRQAQLLKFAGWVSMDSHVTVGCAGAVLCYLQKRRASRFLPGDAAAQAYFRVSNLEMFTMRDTMFVNADTLLSLQIIQSESHPNSHNQGPTKTSSGAKEGLSLYGLFHGLAHTPQGKQMLRQIFLRPSTNITLIEERQASITVFTRPDNEVALAGMCKHLKGVKNVRTLTGKLRKGGAGGTSKGGGIAESIWQGLQKSTYHAIMIFQSIMQDIAGAEKLSISAKISNNFDIFHLKAIGTMIETTIDFEQSQEQHRTVVKPHVDPELDDKKRFYDGIGDLLSAVARDLADRIPSPIPNELNVIYFPQIGYLIAMPMDAETGTSLWQGTEEDHWEKMFTSDTMVYYKNDQMTEMDQEFGDIYSEICDREIEIVHDLAQRVLVHEEMLNVVSDILGELDCLTALAQGARKYRLCRPRVVEENVIQIDGGRHLLQELTVPQFIPNDTYLLGGQDTPGTPTSHCPPPHGPSTLILTGPNYSGKSIHLKQIALIVYLAHIGSFVPATSAHIGLTDKILTRISTRESVSRPQSAFMIDLQQMCLALSLATPRSLLIIDEFSKGTNAVDGAGLAAGVFAYLADLGDRGVAPKTVAATHFHEIFAGRGLLVPPTISVPAVTAATTSLAFAHMEVRIDERVSTHTREQIAYLYNLQPGRSSESFGAMCAALNGIGAEVVERARVLGKWAAEGEDLVVACAGVSGEEARELVGAEHTARRFLATDFAIMAPNVDANALLDDLLAAAEAEAEAMEFEDVEFEDMELEDMEAI